MDKNETKSSDPFQNVQIYKKRLGFGRSHPSYNCLRG